MAMARYDGTAVNTAGDVIPNATVEVRLDQPGRPVVPLWGDRQGTVALGNPIQTDAQGGFYFHVPGGAYWVRVYTGPSQQPTFQKILRYVAIGTAAERDVEQLATMLEAGTATFATVEDLQAFEPPFDEGIGGKVTTGTGAGFYHYDPGAEEGEKWVFDRPLFDTLARMNVVGGDENDIEAEPAPGVESSSVVMLWIEAPGTNTGPVTINAKPLLTTDEEEILPGRIVEGRTYWFSDEGAFYKLRTDSDVSDLVAQAQEAADTAIEKAGEAEAAAQAAVDAAASLNLPTIQPGDAKKQLYVKDDETGYRLDKPARGGGELFKAVADMLADDNEVIGYEGSGAEVEVAPGDIITAQGFRYEVLAGDATEFDEETAGGVRLNLLPAASPFQWLVQPIGVPIPIFAHLFDTINEALPPNDVSAFRYILLTAGESGAGGYNEGVLTSESVSGSSPLVVATAEIDYATSPLDGATVNLLNTEGRYVIAGATSGVVRMDQFQSWQAGFKQSGNETTNFYGFAGSNTGVGTQQDGTRTDDVLPRFAKTTQGTRPLKPLDDGTNGTPRDGSDTHGKDISAVFVMRIA